jgi:hypothetical protein
LSLVTAFFWAVSIGTFLAPVKPEKGVTGIRDLCNLL